MCLLDVAVIVTECTCALVTCNVNSLFSRTTSVCQYQKGKSSLDFNQARDDWFGDAMATAGPYANNLHLAADR